MSACVCRTLSSDLEQSSSEDKRALLNENQVLAKASQALKRFSQSSRGVIVRGDTSRPASSEDSSTAEIGSGCRPGSSYTVRGLGTGESHCKEFVFVHCKFSVGLLTLNMVCFVADGGVFYVIICKLFISFCIQTIKK